jgi:RNA recognition motif-containing protein
MQSSCVRQIAGDSGSDRSLPRAAILRRKVKMRNLFVGNMSFQTTESDLRTAFEQYGEIARIQVMTDRDTGRARGFAFVEMADEQAAANAIAGLNGKELDGRALNVNEAKPKPERSAGGGGGGRGGYGGGGGGGQRRESRW